MRVISIKIDNVLFQAPKRGAIFTGFAIDGDAPGKDKVRIRIPFNVPVDDHIYPGQWWQIIGEEEHFNETSQIVASTALLLKPSGRHIIDFISGDRNRFPGIGKAYAAKLWDNLGNRLYELLEARNDAELCIVMHGIKIPHPGEVSIAMVEGWADLGIGEIISWLDNLPSAGKLGVGLGRKICRCWGIDARKQVEDDPYRLISFMNTRYVKKGWEIIDDIAMNVFKVAYNDDRRLHGALIESIYSHYDNKNTIIDRETLIRKVSDRLGSHNLAREALTRSYNRNSFMHNDEFWQARGVFLMEKEVAEQIIRILRFKQFELFGETRLNFAEIDKAIRDFETNEGYLLDGKQKTAVHLCFENGLTVVTGGPGTGKTSVLKCVYHVIKMAGGEICQMALAGRAARRMSEATGYPARTIAGFLSNNNKDYQEGMTFVIDEASMLDLPTTFHILRKLPEGSRFILVGDADQLPPIGPGLVFHILAKGMVGVVPTIVLSKVYRQEGSTGIPAVAEAIRGNEQVQPTLPELPVYSGLRKGVSVYPAKSSDMANVLKEIYAELGGNTPEKDVKILAITRDIGPCGVGGINNFLHNEYALENKQVLGCNPELGEWCYGYGGPYAEGEPVMFTRNEWERNLFNGTLGIVDKVFDPPSNRHLDSHTPCAKISFDTGTQNITIEDLNSLELAYAITVHKSQGSQFKRVIIPVKKGPLLDKALIYTAVTRGVEQVVLVGDICAVKEAIEKGNAADKRQIGLGHMLSIFVGKENYA